MTTRANTTRTTLIVGGIGKTGRRVAQRLMTRGLPVRVALRSGEQPFDWNNERGWGSALAEAGARDFRAHPRAAAASGAWQS